MKIVEFATDVSVGEKYVLTPMQVLDLRDGLPYVRNAKGINPVGNKSTDFPNATLTEQVVACTLPEEQVRTLGGKSLVEFIRVGGRVIPACASIGCAFCLARLGINS